MAKLKLLCVFLFLSFLFLNSSVNATSTDFNTTLVFGDDTPYSFTKKCVDEDTLFYNLTLTKCLDGTCLNYTSYYNETCNYGCYGDECKQLMGNEPVLFIFFFTLFFGMFALGFWKDDTLLLLSSSIAFIIFSIILRITTNIIVIEIISLFVGIISAIILFLAVRSYFMKKEESDKEINVIVESPEE